MICVPNQTMPTILKDVRSPEDGGGRNSRYASEHASVLIQGGDNGENSAPGEPLQFPYARIVAFRLLVALVFVGFAAASLYGIGSQWQFGHNGYNSAAFVNAARNSLRFGTIGQAQLYSGFTAPSAEHLYTHHPMMVHGHLVAVFGLAGVDPWVGRLIPATYSVLSLMMVFLITKRFIGRREALVASVLYVLTPLHLIFANMINHEQGGIFWCLCTLYGYLSWLEGRRWKQLVATLFAITVAVQFDWPGYYIAFFIAVHLVVIILRRLAGGGPRIRRPPELSFLLIFSAVVLTNLVGFFYWIALARGGLGEMYAAFGRRSLRPDAYIETLIAREWDLHGVLLVVLLVAWLISWLYRLAKRRTHLGELVPAIFLYAQLLHSSLFRQAGIIHSYWVYWIGPAMAIGGAVVIFKAWDGWIRFVGRVAFSRTSPSMSSAVRRSMVAAGLLVVAVLLIYQGRFAWSQWQWGIRTGHASYLDPYEDQFEPISVARFAGQRYPRPTAEFWIDPGLKPRIEFLFYLDAPALIREIPETLAPYPSQKRSLVLIADLQRTNKPNAVAALAAQHRTMVIDGRYVIVDGGSVAQEVELYRFVSRKPPWWWWLVDPLHPPTTIEPAPMAAEVSSSDVFSVTPAENDPHIERDAR